MGTVLGGLVEEHLWRTHHRTLFELGAQRLAEVGHVCKIGRVTMMDPLHHLMRAELLFAQIFLEETLEGGAVEVEDIGTGIAFGNT